MAKELVNFSLVVSLSADNFVMSFYRFAAVERISPVVH